MHLTLRRYNGGYSYSARYRGRFYDGWAPTRAAALAGRLIAVGMLVGQ